jgi:FG-GAP repeat
VGPGNFGISVALSATGDTALVGASRDAGGIGAGWSFRRSGGSWRQESRKLAPPNTFENAGFGLRVALSADGKTALIGGPLDNEGFGAAWVFTRSGSAWRLQAKLKAGHEARPSSFGESVALSADGSTAIVGAPTGGLGAGGVWVFTRTGSGWVHQGPKLTARGEVGPGRFGVSVALSSSGRTAIVGAPLDDNSVGAVYVFTRTGSGWRQQRSKLTIGNATNQAQFGTSVALSADGTTALVGAPVDDEDVGTAWAFTRSGSAWGNRRELSPPGKPGPVQFGDSVALSGRGDTALVGGANDNGDVGTGGVWVFARKGTSWSRQGDAIRGRNERGRGGFGSSVAVSRNGTVALVGGYNDDNGTGAVWTYRL